MSWLFHPGVHEEHGDEFTNKMYFRWEHFMKKAMNVLLSVITLTFLFLFFPFQTEASELTVIGSSNIIISNQTEAMETLTDTYQSILPEGKLILANSAEKMSTLFGTSKFCGF